MNIKQISTKKALAALGSYVQGCIAGDSLLTSEQVGLNPSDGFIVTDRIQAQTKLKKEELVARQASHRGGILYCHVEGGKVKLAGKAILYSAAELSLPESREENE